MTAGALSRNLFVCAILLGGASLAQAAAVGPDSPTAAPRMVALVAAPAPSGTPPLIALPTARAVRSAISVPLPPALLLLGTAVASLLGVRGLRRRS